ncbi:MAG: hypothetical protein IJY04_08535 [Clostridia bacterium]|nr:hypothetical protein [Clostridia bacterium]
MFDYIKVTDYVSAHENRDVSDEIQKIIDENPNRTIYFPDGTYLIGKPIMTPADPKKSVDLQLSNYAMIKATDDWSSDEAMIRLGGKDAFNDIRTPGSNYSLTGGIIDGSNIAKGISIDSGRETAIRRVSIKHVKIGIHIKHGANSGSSDADISEVHIVGNRALDSIGVLVEGYDNTFTDMRIADVFIGIDLRVGGNFLRYLHPLYTLDYTDYGNTCGFRDHSGGNFYVNCYSDQFGVGFRNTKTLNSIYDSCYCFWYAARGGTQTAFKADGKFNSVLTNFRSDFRSEGVTNVLLNVAEPGGKGVFDRLITNPALIADDSYKPYVRGDII